MKKSFGSFVVLPALFLLVGIFLMPQFARAANNLMPMPGSPLQNWTAIAASADGTKLVAAGYAAPISTVSSYLYTSIDSGKTWIPRIGQNISWSDVSMSSDGSIVAAVSRDGPNFNMYLSTDAGTTWTSLVIPTNILPYAYNKNWDSVAVSGDGSKLVVSNYYGIFTSTNTAVGTSTNIGTTWKVARLHFDGRAVRTAVSTNGSRIVAIYNGVPNVSGLNGYSYTSLDGGTTWTAGNINPPEWSRIALSADGTKAVATSYDGHIYRSTDSGKTWSIATTTGSWNAVASSADGMKLVVRGDPSTLYVSNDAGVTWTLSGGTVLGSFTLQGRIQDLAMSADGIKIFAAIYGQDRGAYINDTSCYNFLTNLWTNNTGVDVVALQTWLLNKGNATWSPNLATEAGNGTYGPSTIAAVAAYQAANGINERMNGIAGYFGPLTRAKVNSSCAVPLPTPVISSISPSSGSVGTQVTLTGIFTGVNALQLTPAPTGGYHNISPVSSLDGTHITFTIPNVYGQPYSSYSGDVAVTASNSNGQISNSKIITITQPPAPTGTINVISRLNGTVLPSSSNGMCMSRIIDQNNSTNKSDCIRTLTDQSFGRYTIEWVGLYPIGADTTKIPTIANPTLWLTATSTGNKIDFYIDFIGLPAPLDATVNIITRVGGRVLTATEASGCVANRTLPNGTKSAGGCVYTLTNQPLGSYNVEWLSGYPAGADTSKRPTITPPYPQTLGARPAGTNPVNFYIDFAAKTDLSDPTALFTIEGDHRHTYKVGDYNHYVWKSANADTFSSSYTSNNPSQCGSGPWVANTAAGQSSNNISIIYSGCVWTVTYTAKNSKTGKSASDTVVVIVAPGGITATLDPISPVSRTIKVSSLSETDNVLLAIFDIKSPSDAYARMIRLNVNTGGVSVPSVFSSLRLVVGGQSYSADSVASLTTFSNLFFGLAPGQTVPVSVYGKVAKNVNNALNGVHASVTLNATSTSLVIYDSAHDAPIPVVSGTIAGGDMIFSGETPSNSSTVYLITRVGGRALTATEANGCVANRTLPNGTKSAGGCVYTLTNQPLGSYNVEWLSGYPAGADTSKKPTVSPPYPQTLGARPAGTDPVIFYIDFAAKTDLSDPTALFIIDELPERSYHRYTYQVGQTNHYVWKSANADTFSSSYTSNNPSQCGSGPWVANTAAGQSSSYLYPTYAGCTWTVKYIATNSKTGKSASDTVVVNVAPQNTSTGNIVATLDSASPLQRTILISPTGVTNNVPLAVFDLKSQNVDSTLRTLKVNMNTGSTPVSSVFNDIKIKAGGLTYSADAVASLASFGTSGNVQIPLPKDQYVQVTVLGDIKANINNVLEGVHASVTLNANTTNIVAQNGTSAVVPVTAGTLAGSDAVFSGGGPVPSNLSATLGSPVMNGNTVVAYPVSFNFTLTAGNDTIYVATNPAVAVATSSTGYSSSIANYIPVPNSVTVNPASVSGDAPTYFVIPAGSSRQFTYTGVLPSEAGNLGIKTFKILAINYNTTPTDLWSKQITQGLSALQVASVFSYTASASQYASLWDAIKSYWGF